MKTCVSVALSAVLTASLAMAQEPPSAPSPQMPATPSMDQKGSEDMSKPAGASKSTAPAAKSTSREPAAGTGPMKHKTHALAKHHPMTRHATKQARAKHASIKHSFKKKHR